MANSNKRNLIECPYCGAHFAQHLPREGALGDRILAYLRAQPNAIKVSDIYTIFPSYSQQRIRTCLGNLAGGKLITSQKRGYWSA